jgi:hypothetical protein
MESGEFERWRRRERGEMGESPHKASQSRAKRCKADKNGELDMIGSRRKKRKL